MHLLRSLWIFPLVIHLALATDHPMEDFKSVLRSMKEGKQITGNEVPTAVCSLFCYHDLSDARERAANDADSALASRDSYCLDNRSMKHGRSLHNTPWIDAAISRVRHN